MAHVQHYASHNPEPHSSQEHGGISLVEDDESEWLHRNDAYQMQVTPGMRPILIAQSHRVIP